MVAQNTKLAPLAGLAAIGKVQANAAFASTALYALQNGYFTATVAGNALTVSIKTLAGTDPSLTDPVWVTFRSQTESSGLLTIDTITSAMTLVVPSGATLGALDGVPFQLWLVMFNVGGTLVLAISNRTTVTAGGVYARTAPLSELGLATATAISAGADAAAVFFVTSEIAIPSRPYHVIGVIGWSNGLATAGVWDTAPDLVRLFGPGIKLPGEIVQQRRVDSAVSNAVTGDIPYDDTIPQSTEGSLFFINSITTLSRINFIRSEFLVFGSNSNAASLVNTAALFRDGSTNAIAVSWGKQAAVDEPLMMAGGVQEQALSTTSITYQVRVGGSASGSSSFRLNGIGAARKYGGALHSHLDLTEIMA